MTRRDESREITLIEATVAPPQADSTEREELELGSRAWWPLHSISARTRRAVGQPGELIGQSSAAVASGDTRRSQYSQREQPDSANVPVSTTSRENLCRFEMNRTSAGVNWPHRGWINMQNRSHQSRRSQRPTLPLRRKKCGRQHWLQHIGIFRSFVASLALAIKGDNA
jgi:hypothetical protein